MCTIAKMPNSGMLDHWAFKPSRERRKVGGVVYWMDSWPSQAGYRTARSSARMMQFSRHLQVVRELFRRSTISLNYLVLSLASLMIVVMKYR